MPERPNQAHGPKSIADADGAGAAEIGAGAGREMDVARWRFDHEWSRIPGSAVTGWRFWAGRLNDSLVSQVGVFEIQAGGKLASRDGEIAHHLSDMGVVEFTGHSRGHNDLSIDQKVRDQAINPDAVAKHVEPALRLNGEASLPQLVHQSVFISLLT